MWFPSNLGLRNKKFRGLLVNGRTSPSNGQNVDRSHADDWASHGRLNAALDLMAAGRGLHRRAFPTLLRPPI
jgi:hypothetical protein